MSMTVTASLVVAEDPAALEPRPDGTAVTAFLVAHEGMGTYTGQQLRVSRLLVGEVVCFGDVATAALALHAGDTVEVVGNLELGAALDYPHDDGIYVRLSIKAIELTVN